ncbi:Unknown protein [Striga hermonthica]|uniref:Uncharacterized protein n=1 Tax=Striga hermonthica TaxID=68872 RepID=A0A9N7RPA2_STRHE|nr:Unknown protein [Striga hermonthica]
MTPAKNSKETTAAAEAADLASEYEAPFAIHSRDEGDRFESLASRGFTPPRYLDFDLVPLSVVTAVRGYCRKLGWDKFVLTRHNGGSDWTSEKDLFYLWCVRGEERVCTPSFLLAAFKSVVARGSRVKLCLGNFITAIAVHSGVFDPYNTDMQPLPARALGLGMLKIKKVEFSVNDGQNKKNPDAAEPIVAGDLCSGGKKKSDASDHVYWQLKKMEKQMKDGLDAINARLNGMGNRLDDVESKVDSMAACYRTLESKWVDLGHGKSEVKNVEADECMEKLTRIKKVNEEVANTCEEGEKLELSNSKEKNDGLINVSGFSRKVPSANSTGSRRSCEPSKKGDGCLARPWTQVDIFKDNRNREPRGSGASETRSISRDGPCFHKTARFSGDIVGIMDSDDEATPHGETADTSNRDVGSNVRENNLKFVQIPSCGQRSKRSRTESTDDLLPNSTVEKKGKMRTSQLENEFLKSARDEIDCSLSIEIEEVWSGPPGFESQTPVRELNNGLNNVIRADLKYDTNFSAELKSDKLGRKFNYEADMLRAFQEDDQFCMEAVCALYRRHMKLKGRSNISKNGGFSPVDFIRGCALAEYLIDGDKELRLRKSVSQVKMRRPEAIGVCRKLANFYVEKLLAVYRSGEDPLFGQ